MVIIREDVLNHLFDLPCFYYEVFLEVVEGPRCLIQPIVVELVGLEGKLFEVEERDLDVGQEQAGDILENEGLLLEEVLEIVAGEDSDG